MFEGLDRQQAWRLFYDVACLCHPCQGGVEADMQGLCSLARGALDDWPREWTAQVPALFDIFCRVTGTRRRDAADATSEVRPCETSDVRPYVVDEHAWAPAGRVGVIRLLAAASSNRAAGPACGP